MAQSALNQQIGYHFSNNRLVILTRRATTRLTDGTTQKIERRGLNETSAMSVSRGFIKATTEITMIPILLASLE